MIDFALLGPVAVRRGDVELPITAARQRVILATLTLEANRPVSLTRLIAVLWADDPPRTAVMTLRTYIRELRLALGGRAEGLIATRPAAYQLQVEPDRVDLLRFLRGVAEARQAARDHLTDRATACYRTALGLWRGEPLADLAAEGWLVPEAAWLADLRLDAVEELVDLELAAGRAAQSIALLQPLAVQWPLREPLRARLIRALHQSGRTADALHEYQAARESLVADVGIEPGQALRAAHRVALGGTDEPSVPVPAMLPTVISVLTGRTEQLAGLDDLVAHRSPTVAIAVVSGTAGVGKTALAVHWAHGVAHRFPDGQLYLDLRGFDPSRSPVDPGAALHHFLTALGVGSSAIPDAIETRAALYRSVLTGKRLLIVLDNARDAAQVAPLLPASPGTVTVVTSRDQLLPLVATAGARPLPLDLLTHEQSVEFFERAVGRGRVSAEPEAVAEVIDRCARLPLAMAIVAARAATQHRLGFGGIAEGLRDATSVLDVLRTGAAAADARQVLSWSTETLGPEASRVFRLLGVHPGPDLTSAVAASLAALAPQHARTLMDDLARGQLLTEDADGRYALHDLLRCHAVELAGQSETSRSRREAVHRLVDHYVHTARAARRFDPAPPSTIPDLPAAADGAQPHGFADRPAAERWLSAEQPALVRVVRAATDTPGLEDRGWRLARMLTGPFIDDGHLADLQAIHESALACALRTDDVTGAAYSHYGLAMAAMYDERYEAAGTWLDLAHGGFTRLEHVEMLANVQFVRGRLLGRRREWAEALQRGRQAYALYRASGSDWGVGAGLNTIGWCLSHLGDQQQALRHCRRSLDLRRELGDESGVAATWHTIGYVHLQTSNYPGARAAFANALDIVRDTPSQAWYAGILADLAEVHRAARAPSTARELWLEALAIFDHLDHPRARAVRARLHDGAPDGSERSEISPPGGGASARPCAP